MNSVALTNSMVPMNDNMSKNDAMNSMALMNVNIWEDRVCLALLSTALTNDNMSTNDAMNFNIWEDRVCLAFLSEARVHWSGAAQRRQNCMQRSLRRGLCRFRRSSWRCHLRQETVLSRWHMD